MATSYYLFMLSAEEIELDPPYYPWDHNGIMDALDAARYPMVTTYMYGESY